MDRLNDLAPAVVKKKSVRNGKGKQIKVGSPQRTAAPVRPTCQCFENDHFFNMSGVDK